MNHIINTIIPPKPTPREDVRVDTSDICLGKEGIDIFERFSIGLNPRKIRTTFRGTIRGFPASDAIRPKGLPVVEIGLLCGSQTWWKECALDKIENDYLVFNVRSESSIDPADEKYIKEINNVQIRSTNPDWNVTLCGIKNNTYVKIEYEEDAISWSGIVWGFFIIFSLIGTVLLFL